MGFRCPWIRAGRDNEDKTPVYPRNGFYCVLPRGENRNSSVWPNTIFFAAPSLQGGSVKIYKPRLKPGLCFHGPSGRGRRPNFATMQASVGPMVKAATASLQYVKRPRFTSSAATPGASRDGRPTRGNVSRFTSSVAPPASRDGWPTVR